MHFGSDGFGAIVLIVRIGGGMIPAARRHPLLFPVDWHAAIREGAKKRRGLFRRATFVTSDVATAGAASPCADAPLRLSHLLKDAARNDIGAPANGHHVRISGP